MPTYVYRARDKEGRPLTGMVEADGELSVASNISSLGYSVISVEEKKVVPNPFAGITKKFKKSSKYELAVLSRQLASLLKAGISITEAISSLTEQTKSTLLKEKLKEVLLGINSGKRFSEALSEHPDVFSELFISMVKVGESSGVLDDVLDKVSEILFKEVDIRMRVQSAFIYPVILVLAAIGIVSFLLINIVPKFVVVFDTYEAKLPVATQILLALSVTMRKFWPGLVIGALAIGIWFKRFVSTEKGKYALDGWLLKMPLTGDLYMKVVVSRFARSLGVLLKSGVSMLEALDVTEKVVGNAVIARVIRTIRAAIVEGKTLTEPFKTSGIFPPMVIQMIHVGEQSGKLDDMLVDVANFYEKEVDYAVKNMTTALEPVLLLMMGGMVAFIALSVLLPIFNLVKVFRH